MATHSPTPWRISSKYGDADDGLKPCCDLTGKRWQYHDIWLEDADGKLVGSLSLSTSTGGFPKVADMAEHRANASLVIEAVNRLAAKAERGDAN